MVRIIIIWLFFATSCNIISKKSYGIKKQKTESPESIKKWLVKQRLYSDHIFSISPEQFLEFTLITQNAPLMFDKKSGRLLALGFRNGNFSPEYLNQALTDVLPFNLLKTKPDSFLVSESVHIPPGYTIKDKEKFQRTYDTTILTLKKIYQSSRTLTGGRLTEIPEDENDYILIIPFAIYLGEKIQSKNLTNYYYSAISNRFSKIKIVFLNIDKQQWWGENWNNTNTMKYK